MATCGNCNKDIGERTDHYCQEPESSGNSGLLLSLEHVTKCGQIQEGDNLAILDNRGEVHIEKAKVIIRPGNTAKTDGEEIVLRKAKNIYFITDLYLDGKSWVKECHIVKAQ